MKRCMLLLLTLFPFVAIVAQNQTVASLGKKEAAVWNKVVALNNLVFGTKDSVGIANLVSNNVHYGHSGGNIEQKNEMVHKASISPTQYKNLEHELISLKMLGKTAVVRYVFKARSIEKGVETPLHLGIIQVWQNERGNWQLVERQAVKLSTTK